MLRTGDKSRPSERSYPRLISTLMPLVQLRYGKTTIPFEYDAERFTILGSDATARPLTDIELGEKLDQSIQSERFEDIVGPGETVLFVVPDATRETACGRVINL